MGTALTQNGRKGADLTIRGQLANFLKLGEDTPKGEDRTLAMVAGVGFEPTTFRL